MLQFYRTEPVVPQLPNPLETAGQLLTLKSAMQQQRIGSMQEQQMQLELEDQQKIRQAFAEAQGDWDKTFELASQMGVSPAMLAKLDAGRLERRQKLAAATKEEREAWLKQAEITGQASLAFKELRAKNPQEAEQAYAAFRPRLEEALGRKLPDQLPDDGTLDFLIMSSKTSMQELRAQKGTPGVDVPFSPEVEAQKRRISDAARERQLVPGVDVPYPPAVEQQKGRLAAAGRTIISPGQSFRILSADESKAMGLPQGTVAQVNAAGKVDVISQPNAKMTGAHSTALRYLLRGAQASDDILAVEDKISKMGLGGQTRLKFAPNIAQTEEGQLYKQAARSFTEARLRKDSGAAIPTYEFDNDERMYFAQPGDSKEVLAQKRTARAKVLEGIAAEAGPAFEDYFGEAFKPGMFVEKYAPIRRPQGTGGERPPLSSFEK